MLLCFLFPLAVFSQDMPGQEIVVTEWGVVFFSLTGELTAVGTPGSAADIGGPDHNWEGTARAPVIYFNGPEFSGTVRVTANGSIFEVHPPPQIYKNSPDIVEWHGRFTYDNSQLPRPPQSEHLPAGYQLWRDGQSMIVHLDNNYREGFLYYEVMPYDLKNIPVFLRAGIPDQYEDIPAVAVMAGSWQGNHWEQLMISGRLGDIAAASDRKVAPLDGKKLRLHLEEWAETCLTAQQFEAFWATWKEWLLYDYLDQADYSNGYVLYLLPAEQTEIISQIEIIQEETDYPVRLQRWLLIAAPW